MSRAAFFWRLVQLQLIDGDVPARKHAQHRGGIPLATTRGVIRDAYGKVLAANRPSYNVYVVPAIIDMDKTWPRVAQLMGLEETEAVALKKTILETREKPGPKREQQTPIKVDVDRDVVAALKTHEAELRGVEVAPAPVRYYPYGELGAQLIGYMREVDSETLARLGSRGYKAGDRLGAVGVERRWESYLRGQRGWRKVVRGLKHKNREKLEPKYLEDPRHLDPVPGRDVSLTSDIEVQKAFERAMRGQWLEPSWGRRAHGTPSLPRFPTQLRSQRRLRRTGQDGVREAFQRLSRTR